MSKGSQPKHARKAQATNPQTTPTAAAEQPILNQSTQPADTSTYSDAGATLHNQQTTHAESTISPQAQDIVDKLNAVDDRVTQLRKSRAADPDTALDKLIGMAVPSLAGMVAGKIFSKLWNLGSSAPKNSRQNDIANVERTSLLMELLFAACSAAFVAVVTQLSDKSSRAVIKRLQQRRK